MTEETRHRCLRCNSDKRATSFSCNKEGKRLTTCKICILSIRDQPTLRNRQSTVDPVYLLERWRAELPFWKAAGYNEATIAPSSHRCKSDLLATRLSFTNVLHNEIVVYCDKCRVVWRTGQTTQTTKSIEAVIEWAEARY